MGEDGGKRGDGTCATIIGGPPAPAVMSLFSFASRPVDSAAEQRNHDSRRMTEVSERLKESRGTACSHARGHS